MFPRQLFAAIAAAVLIIGASPGVRAQYHRTGSPGFGRSIYIPSARDRRPRYGDANDYRNPRDFRRYGERDDRHLTIINGGQNCFNCRIEDSNDRRGDRRYSGPRR
jgi:hypothetical protein